MKILGAILLAVGVAASAAATDLEVGPRYFDFAGVQIGQTRKQSFYVRNVTGRDVNFVSFRASGDTTQFKVDDFFCRSIPRFGTCWVDVTYQPRDTRHHFLRVEINGPTSGGDFKARGQGLNGPGPGPGSPVPGR